MHAVRLADRHTHTETGRLAHRLVEMPVKMETAFKQGLTAKATVTVKWRSETTTRYGGKQASKGEKRAVNLQSTRIYCR